MTNLKLSNRLLKISSLVKNHDVIIDVGCDHALLDIYLTKNKIVKKAIATDITRGAIKMALKNVSYYDCLNVDVREGNGLDTLKKEDNVSLIIMSGLGNQKIVSILNDNKEKLSNIKKLVISSNNKFYQVREKITKLGFIIESEAIVLEDGKYYIIMKFIKGNKNYSYKELYFGPCLLENKNRMFYKYYTYLKDEKENILSMIPSSLSNKRHVINEEIKMLTLEIKS